jgi:hypothetical protein
MEQLSSGFRQAGRSLAFLLRGTHTTQTPVSLARPDSLVVVKEG